MERQQMDVEGLEQLPELYSAETRLRLDAQHWQAVLEALQIYRSGVEG
jgi:hypothetical protein